MRQFNRNLDLEPARSQQFIITEDYIIQKTGKHGLMEAKTRRTTPWDDKTNKPAAKAIRRIQRGIENKMGLLGQTDFGLAEKLRAT